MIIDTSAMVAIIQGESEAEEFAELLVAAQGPSLSAASYLESAVVIDSQRDPRLSRNLDLLIRENEISIEPVSARQAEVARQAYRDFGKGSGHPAGLNFGDCFAYALAFESGEPLLFKGDDFAHTGIAAAWDSQA